jgi:hypothetical protein
MNAPKPTNFHNVKSHKYLLSDNDETFDYREQTMGGADVVKNADRPYKREPAIKPVQKCITYSRSPQTKSFYADISQEMLDFKTKLIQMNDTSKGYQKSFIYQKNALKLEGTGMMGTFENHNFKQTLNSSNNLDIPVISRYVSIKFYQLKLSSFRTADTRENSQSQNLNDRIATSPSINSIFISPSKKTDKSSTRVVKIREKILNAPNESMSSFSNTYRSSMIPGEIQVTITSLCTDSSEEGVDVTIDN